MFGELGVGDRDRRDLGIDAERDDVLVDELADLAADRLAEHGHALAVAIASPGVDEGQRLGVLDEGKAFRARQHEVERVEELLQLDRELRAQPLVAEKHDACLGVGQVIDSSSSGRGWRIGHADRAASESRP